MNDLALLETASVAEGVLETPVSFTVEGAVLRGILSLPVAGKPSAGVVFSHGWSGNRNGPAGILTMNARNLAKHGCACLRFDFRGRGESGGDGLSATLGTMSLDLTAAVAELKRRTALDKILVFGMCSGGNIAIGSLKQLPEVCGMILLSVYPFSDGDSFGRDVNRTGHFLKVYLRKACSPATWRRVFSGDASLGRAMRVLLRPFLKRGENKVKEEGTARTSRSVKASGNESRLAGAKPAPKKYLANLRKDLPCIMIYGTADPDATAAREYYSSYCEREQLPVSFRNIEGANHNFSSWQWQNEVAEAVLEFGIRLIRPIRQ